MYPTLIFASKNLKPSLLLLLLPEKLKEKKPYGIKILLQIGFPHEHLSLSLSLSLSLFVCFFVKYEIICFKEATKVQLLTLPFWCSSLIGKKAPHGIGITGIRAT
jgi:hypothetical protein